jgi:hypothetical protein
MRDGTHARGTIGHDEAAADRTMRVMVSNGALQQP